MQKSTLWLLWLSFFLFGCPATSKRSGQAPSDVTYRSKPVSDFWKNATIYFLLTDRFYNGDPTNDLQFDRKPDGAVLRSFEGGDIKGVTAKIEEGYFDALGVTAIWMTPVFEQITSHTDEGTGKTYAYHGYWTRDWTSLDPNFGTEEDLAEMVRTAHQHGIRVLLDAVVNHTGPVTPLDSQWPDEWVRVGPKCGFTDYETTVTCALVDNLPDIRTESTTPVKLPAMLAKKWRKEGRYDRETASLERYFARTGYPRYPHHYIIKWLVDWVRKYGIDGFRVDTTKHTEAFVWSILKKECDRALRLWKEEHATTKLDDLEFYMVGEVYGYGISGKRLYDYGDRKVDFFNYGYESLINFEFKYDAEKDYESIFSKYSDLLQSQEMKDLSVLNYLSSHDDGSPFDGGRVKTFEAGTKLLLSPGAAQIYYGDETARTLQVPGTEGDATLRSNMNWNDVEEGTVSDLLLHWRKLGSFRAKQLAVGAGSHLMLQTSPYVFQRSMPSGEGVVVGLDQPEGRKEIPVGDVFADGMTVTDHYSDQQVTIDGGMAVLSSPYDIVLLGVD